MNRKNRNIAVVDCEPNSNRTWSDFVENLEIATKQEWELIGKNQRGGVLQSFKKYIHWFWKSFILVLQRKRIKNFVALQQFYGLCFAFYCRMFHCKKLPKSLF